MNNTNLISDTSTFNALISAGAVLTGVLITLIGSFITIWLNGIIEEKRVNNELKKQMALQKADFLSREKMIWLKELRNIYADYVVAVQAYFTASTEVNAQDAFGLDYGEALEKTIEIEKDRIKNSRLIVSYLDDDFSDQLALHELVLNAELVIEQYSTQLDSIKKGKDQTINEKHEIIMKEIKETNAKLVHIDFEASKYVQAISRKIWQELKD